MNKYIYLAIFGFLGAILRHLAYSLNLGDTSLNTLLINVLGSFALAVILALSFSTRHLSLDFKLGITVGLLGAFTTFSTLCKEIYMFIYTGNYAFALLYISASIILGLGAVYAGNALEKGAL